MRADEQRNTIQSSREEENIRSFMCIITQDLMEDPVIAEDEHSYEKEAIQRWMRENYNVSPVTRQRMNPNILIPNRNLKNAIEEYRAKIALQNMNSEIYEASDRGILERSRLHQAAKNGYLAEVKAILEQGLIDINDQSNEERNTPLITAAKNNRTEVIRYLVNQGADVTCLNKYSDDALNISLFLKQNMRLSSILMEKYFITDQRLRKLLERGARTFNGRPEDKTVTDIVYEIIGSERLKNWEDDTRLCRNYKMFLENITELRHEHQDLVRVNGSYLDEVLGIRLYLYISFYLELKSNREPNADSYIQENLFREIKVISDTIIGERFRNYHISFQGQINLSEERAKSVLNKLEGLRDKEEYIIRSGYEGNPGHCLYVSFVKFVEDKIIVRIDNRWIKEDRVDGRLHSVKHIGEIKKIKSYYVGTFTLTAHKRELIQYIMGIIQSTFLEGTEVDKGLENIYGVNLPETIKNSSGDVKNYIESWPYYQIQSNDNGNCVLSSYNYGISIRHGEEFFRKLEVYEAIKVFQIMQMTSRGFNFTAVRGRNAFEQTDRSIARLESTEGVVSRVEAVRDREVSQASVSETRSTPRSNSSLQSRLFREESESIETITRANRAERVTSVREESRPENVAQSIICIELIKKLEKELSVDFNELYQGIILEQALVGMAGIDTWQSNASFEIDRSTITFLLKFNGRYELYRFMHYYNLYFPGLVIQEDVSYESEGLTAITMDTRKFYSEIAEELGAYHTGRSSISNRSIARLERTEGVVSRVEAVKDRELSQANVSETRSTPRSNSSLQSQLFREESESIVTTPRINCAERVTSVREESRPENITQSQLTDKFASEFKVSSTIIVQKTIVEQALVGMAEISTKQSFSKFQVDEINKHITTFWLTFRDKTELNKFKYYFNQTYPGLIRSQNICLSLGDKTDIKMNTGKLYYEVATKLGEFHNRRGLVHPEILHVVRMDDSSRRDNNDTTRLSWAERISAAREEPRPENTAQSTISTELIKKLEKELSVDFNELYQGTILEQALVGMAGINTVQSNASFEIDRSTITFWLEFNGRNELDKFKHYYDQNFSGLIIRKNVSSESEDLTAITMDTRKFYSEVVEELGAYHTGRSYISHRRSTNTRQENLRECCLS
ncbi:ankyrin repeat domain-containing protein [Holosporaceae bacterium 'Namur']|nr:ankyrin repeat domain-containing protein [Holosporaceae bacterium 'Namur']